MTTTVDIVNRALQAFGSRTTVTSVELANSSTNEAIQANLILTQTRDELLRMAPWDCGLATANLVYITSSPGTPENSSPATTLWQPGQPSPPWAYEYQYPVDCLKACWIIPATQTGFPGGLPITTAVTGSAPNAWTPPIRYRVQTDKFYPVTAAAVSIAGLGYAVGDLITLVSGPTDSPPIGAPAVLLVTAISGIGPLGPVQTVSVVNQVAGSSTPLGGSYFAKQIGPIAQGSTTGSGLGAVFTLTFGAQGDQRVILTNQEFATLAYVRQITNPDSTDPLFQQAWIAILGARLGYALTGDRNLANQKIAEANAYVIEARKADGNEGLTINDVTPDWIRLRGIEYPSGWDVGPYSGYDWGNMFAMY